MSLGLRVLTVKVSGGAGPTGAGPAEERQPRPRPLQALPRINQQAAGHLVIRKRVHRDTLSQVGKGGGM